MEFPVKIDENEILAIIRKVVKETASQYFILGDHYKNPGEGYTAVVAQTKKFLCGVDLSDLVKEEATKILNDGLLRDQVERSLQTEIKKEVAKLKKQGLLFDKQ